MAHYSLLELTVDPTLHMDLKLTKTDTVNILIRVPNEDKYGSSVSAIGQINGGNSHQ